MKRILISTALALGLCMSVGCKTVTAPTAPQTLAPGYINGQDQTMGKVLAGVHAYIAKMQAQISDNTFTPSATDKQALNALIATADAAYQTYNSYHAGAATEAAAQTAVNTAYAQQQAVSASTGVK